MVVSPSTEATRPQVAANLAAAYAEAGQRVVVLGTGDLGAGPIRGSGQLLTGEITPEDVESRLEASWVDRVFRLDLRHFIENSGQLVLRMPAVLKATKAAVRCRSSSKRRPCSPSTMWRLCPNSVDVALVVGECGTTTFDEARRSGDLLRRMSAPVLGVVVTNVRLQYRDPASPATGGPVRTDQRCRSRSESRRSRRRRCPGVRGPSPHAGLTPTRRRR